MARNPGGHSSTNTPLWLQMVAGSAGAATDDDLYNIPCFQSIKYEPYIVLRRSAALPLFDERFSGYGKNKIEFVQHLRFLDFSFVVLPELFLVRWSCCLSLSPLPSRMSKLLGGFIAAVPGWLQCHYFCAARLGGLFRSCRVSCARAVRMCVLVGQVHLPHTKSDAFVKWLDTDYQRVDALFDEFVADLAVRYAGQYGTPMCGDDDGDGDGDGDGDEERR
jgi:hypothetical protein